MKGFSSGENVRCQREQGRDGQQSPERGKFLRRESLDILHICAREAIETVNRSTAVKLVKNCSAMLQFTI